MRNLPMKKSNVQKATEYPTKKQRIVQYIFEWSELSWEVFPAMLTQIAEFMRRQSAMGIDHEEPTDTSSGTLSS